MVIKIYINLLEKTLIAKKTDNNFSIIHHIHKNSRRVDDFHTIPLCFNHHREGSNNHRWVSRHPWKKEFESRYGDEWTLFDQVKRILND